jgi:hypothetical protein
MKAIQTLNAMIRQDLQSRYPEVPARFLTLKPVKCNSANSLTQCILKYIRLSGGHAERVNTQGRRIDHTRVVTDVLGYKRQIGSVKWVPGTSTRGSADIHSVINGKSVAIEVKWGRDRQSDDQKVYEQSVTAAGGVYLIIRNLEEFVEWYKQQ